MRPQWLAQFGLFLLAAGVIYGLMLAPVGAVPARYQERASTPHRSPPPIHGSEVNGPGLADTEASQTYARNVELVGQIGGPTEGLTIQGDYAYAGIGPRLVLLEVSDPSHPTVAGQSVMLPDFIRDVYVVGPHAYVADGCAGLRVIEISNPVTPTEMGVYDTPGRASGVYVTGRYAYVADGDSGLRVLDISDPSSLLEVAARDTPRPGEDVYIAGNHAYLALGAEWDPSCRCYMSGGLLVFDISNPIDPLEVGFYEMTGSAQDIYATSHYAYMASTSIWDPSCSCSVGGGLRVIDVSDPTNVEEVGFYDAPRDVSAVYVAGSYAYVMIGLDGGLRVVDVSDPAEPVEVGALDMPGGSFGIHVLEPYAYVADREAGLRVVDVSSPTAPVEVGAYHTPGSWGYVYAVAPYAYVTSEDGLGVIDVSNPVAPVTVGFYDMPSSDVHVAGHYAYVLGDGLRVVDVSDPAAPREVGVYSAAWDALSIYVAGHYAYVAVAPRWDSSCACYAGGGLRVVDISDPTTPVEVGAYYAAWSAVDVYVAGDYAYLAAGSDGLRVIDVSNPAAPVEVGATYAGTAYGVYVASSRAYVADGWYDGLRVIDVSDPAAPVMLSRYKTPGFGRDVYAVCPYVYLADDFGFWPGSGSVTPTWVFNARVIDVSNPAMPVEVGAYRTPVQALSIHVAGPYVYVRDSDWGLYILRFAPSASAMISTRGGGLTSPTDQTVYAFAARTFTDTVTSNHIALSADHVPSTGDLTGVGHFFDVNAVYNSSCQSAQPTRPYTLIVQYTDTEKGPAIESTLALYWWNGTQWVREPTSIVVPEANMVTATPDRLGLWAVLGETRRMLLPVVLRSN